MNKVNFQKVKPGDLVQVPRTQFAPMRHGWNGWLFSEAIVIHKAIGKNSGRPIIRVKMRTPGKRSEGLNSYGTHETNFDARAVFYTGAVERAERLLLADGFKPGEDLDEFLVREEICGADWIRFLNDEGRLFQDQREEGK